jgi:hypothetical protein
MNASRFRPRNLLDASAVLILLSLQLPVLVLGQTETSGRNAGSQASAGEKGDAAETPVILRMSVREIVVSVVAIDRHNQPVSDMKESEFQVLEVGKWSKQSRQTLSAFHVMDPPMAMPKLSRDAGAEGFRVRSDEGCAFSWRTHYEIAFHPSPGGWTGGYHEVLVTTSRPHVKLLFRRRYYVGETKMLSKPGPLDDPKQTAELRLAACYHSLVPPSILLSVQPVPTADNSLQFSVAAHTDSLTFIALQGEARQVQLDYGICTFDADGLPLNYMQTSIERALTPVEYERAMARGFEEQIQLPSQGDAAVVRFVVRDRKTGNLGTLTVTIPNPARDALVTAQSEERIRLQEDRAQADIARKGYLSALDGPIRSFGSIVPQPGAMCGDVYELPTGIPQLPDFWSLQPIGTIYTYELDVPGQNVKSSSAIPGVTPKIDGFGIDYYGAFNIKTAGDYTFELLADDSAKLYIDGGLIINLDWLHDTLGQETTLHLDAGRHTLHLPYMDSIGGLALMLLIKPPGGEYRVFNLQDFSLPTGAF